MGSESGQGRSSVARVRFEIKLGQMLKSMNTRSVIVVSGGVGGRSAAAVRGDGREREVVESRSRERRVRRWACLGLGFVCGRGRRGDGVTSLEEKAMRPEIGAS